MKIINTKLHGIIDYGTALVLLLPWITDFNVTGKDTLVLATIGSLIGLYSIVTDYEFGMVKALPMKAHLAIDVLISLALIAIPFILNFSHYTKWPIVVGVTGLIVTILTDPRPYTVSGRDLNITKP